MARPRKHNQGLPARWDVKNGTYSYLPRKHERPFFDNKSRFTLSKNLSEAHTIFAERLKKMERREGEINTLGQAFDGYELRQLPTLASATKQGYLAHIKKLRPVFKDVSIYDFKPAWAYKYFEKNNKTSAAHHEVKMLNTIFSWLVSIGEVDTNPLKGQVTLANPSNKPKRYVEDWEIEAALNLTPKNPRGGLALLQSYIQLKLMTGMSQGDLLRLKLDTHLTDEGIEIQRHKTKNKTGLRTIYIWTPELREAVDRAKSARGVDISPYLFCNNKGECYVNEDTGKAEGMKTLWRGLMRRLLSETNVTEKFTEHDLRRKVASDAPTLEHARDLLSHADSKTTSGVYRVKPVKVKHL